LKPEDATNSRNGTSGKSVFTDDGPVAIDLISTVTDGVVTEITAWQTRPLEPMYPVVIRSVQ
jgi:transposase-like protein